MNVTLPQIVEIARSGDTSSARSHLRGNLRKLPPALVNQATRLLTLLDSQLVWDHEFSGTPLNINPEIDAIFSNDGNF